ncbi:MAG: hypothetical protein ACRDQG_17845, partial [Pseudonocardiaceae bacterium]
RAHLEDVLAAGIRDERGAPCPVCAAQRHVTGPSSDESPLTGVAPGVEDSDRPAERHTAPRLVRRWAHHDPTGTSDTWRCPACHNTWTEAEYRLRISDDYLANADALTARDIEAQYGIKAGVLRKRAERDPRIRRGRNDSGQRLYDVRRVLAIGATTPEEMLESAVRLP